MRYQKHDDNEKKYIQIVPKNEKKREILDKHGCEKVTRTTQKKYINAANINSKEINKLLVARGRERQWFQNL